MDKRQPADNNKAYYYHFDGLGSVVALSNSNGDSCQSYEYSAYGQVAASDPNHPNPYMFTGRRFDIETGLYYYRARYYNPHIGRFMQTDPIGYGYGYCGNNPLNFVDPSGLVAVAFYDPDDPLYRYDENAKIVGQIDGGFEEYADDFTYYYKMDNFGDVIKTLQNLHEQGVEVTEVYFYDHCDNEGTTVTGLQFGDDHYYFDDGKGSMGLFAHFRETGWLAKDATLHFRHCFLGMEENKSSLTNLAEWTQGDVTGVNGWILPKAMGINRNKGKNGWKMSRPWYYFVNEISGWPDYSPYEADLSKWTLSNYSIASYHTETGEVTWDTYKPGTSPKVIY